MTAVDDRRPATAVAGRRALPGNRWDLLDGQVPAEPPTVSVIVAHYRQQAELDRTLLALGRQTHPADRLQIIVVDDGSPVAPTVAPGIRLLVQPDLGFRLAAARNLGASAATGELLCFLDADTTPEPGYIAALCRLPALAPDVVTVGRRRHTDLGGVPAGSPIEVAGPPRELPEPGWLVDAYRGSHDLLEADDRSYRYVIGAVICCSRALFDAAGGFDETFSSYGGEDWEWAYRAWLHGALFAHVRAAVAWHDGPAWEQGPGRRDDARRLKNAETLQLAQRVAVPGGRGAALRTASADVVVRIRAAASLAALVVCVDRVLLAAPSVTVVLPLPELCAFDEADDLLGAAFADDPRVVGALTAAAPAEHDRPGGRLLVDIDAPVQFEAQELQAALDRVGRDGLGRLRVNDAAGQHMLDVVALRAARREQRWGRRLFERAETSWASGARITAEPDLAAYFAAVSAAPSAAAAPTEPPNATPNGA
ncbi:glycosyltransferase [Subtercola sp. YIM 133946]|uniref:glycosyltransferase n=1 Tax=Subtercola sp. YIM 133946 TaxID=3118909 RepID=UPI002F954C89